MQHIISDASILIDIENSDLIGSMFSLPYQFAVPDVLFEEELSERHSHLLHFGLMTKVMAPELMAEAYNLRQQSIKTSVNDLLALILAKAENSFLLTGDKALRKTAEIFNIEVHGIIWLVDQMIYHKKISINVAQNAFHRMKNAGSWFPSNAVADMLRKHELAQSNLNA